MTSVLITGIIIYAIGAYLTAAALGFFRPYMDDDLALLITYIWPLALIFIGVISIIDWIDYWTYRNPGTAPRIGSILDLITIPFRPIALGRKIRKWLDNRKGGER